MSCPSCKSATRNHSYRPGWLVCIRCYLLIRKEV